MKDHLCSNIVDPNNLIDKLKENGGYSKQIKKIFAAAIIHHAKKLERLLMVEELEEDTKTDSELDEESDMDMDEESNNEPDEESVKELNEKCNESHT